MKAFNKVLVIYSEKLTKGHLASVEKVRKIVDGSGALVVRSAELNENNFKNIDLVVTLGGDGTFVRAASFIKDETPILGINSEQETSEGALLSLKDNELDALKDIINGNYNISISERIKLNINGVEIMEHALNEVYVGTDSQFHTSRYIIKFEGKEEEQRSSGVLVVNASGSTAWFKSAGGKPFKEDKLAFFVREPYFGNRVFKPKILGGDIKRGEKIEFEGKRFSGGIIALDANTVYPFNNGDKAEISFSDKPLRVIVKS